MNRGQISNKLRKLGLLYIIDWVRFYFQKCINRKINRTFRKENPEVALPPDYLIYESFQINYKKYYTDSIDSANWLVEHFKRHIDLRNRKVLDWGCGPARIIRHLPDIMTENCEFFGTDYNRKSIDWCSRNLPGINFNLNALEARLPYKDASMDIIYGISIFTHLSEKMHYDWYEELYRVLSPGGIMFLTTQGKNYKVKLTEEELSWYNEDRLIVRGKVKEGHRTYSAFHPVGFMRNLFSNAEILEHIEQEPKSNKILPQDIWIIKK